MSSAKERSFVSAITARPDIRLFFIFGQDESAIADIAAKMATQLSGAERIDLDSDLHPRAPWLIEPCRAPSSQITIVGPGQSTLKVVPVGVSETMRRKKAPDPVPEALFPQDVFELPEHDRRLEVDDRTVQLSGL